MTDRNDDPSVATVTSGFVRLLAVLPWLGNGLFAIAASGRGPYFRS
ncbi:MAG: hypothetical protein ACFCVG_03015 [Kineosporiaceae bacterium]